jgi:hypothetical protein
VNSAEAIQAIVREGPQDIRVLCPNGHLIVNMTISVVDGDLTAIRRRSGKDLQRRRLRGQINFGGHVHISTDRNTTLQCTNNRCHYRGYRNEMQLYVELAESALAGHAEHRLTI